MKKIFISFLLITLLSLPIFVYATDDNSDPTDGGGNGTCTGDGCNNHYNTGASGFRVSLVDKNGNMVSGTRAYDYWFQTSDTETRWNQSAKDYCLNKKYIKQQIMGKTKIADLVVSCPKSFNSATTLVADFGSYYDPQNVDTAVKKLVKLANDAENSITHENWNVYNQIFKDINFKVDGKYKTVATFTSTERKNYYFQFEPLISFKNAGAYVTDSIFYGTISELINLGYQGGINNGGSMYAFNNPIVSIIVKNKYIGVVAPKSNLPKIFNQASSSWQINGFASFFAKKNNKYYAYGVDYLYMDDVLPKCNPDADLIVDDYTKFLDKDGKKPTSLIDAWRKLVEKYTEIQTSFKNSENKINAFNPDVIAIMKGNNFKSPETNKYIGSTTGYPSNTQFAGVRCNVTYTCQEIADGIFYKYYNSNQTEYEKYIKILQNAYPTYNLLKTSWWQAFGYSKPLCDNDGPVCPPSYEKGKCETGKDIFNYSDSNSTGCWARGIAYTIEDSDIVQSSIYQRTSNNCYAYCKQSVTYNFPLDVTTKTKAGTVFKWGTNTANDVFGTMNINMTCTIGRPSKATTNCKGNYSIGSSNGGYNNIELLNDNSTNTVVKIMYDEPSSNLDISGGDIKTTLVESTKNKNSVTCNDAACSNKPTFNLTAKYNLVYNDNKLKWYSLKTDGSLIDANHYDNGKKTYYYDIGYGLPTAFTTATGIYGLNGEMTARLTNPGTKNVVSPTDKGHFTQLLKAKEGQEYLEYSCKFAIKNQIYENECEYDDAGNLISGSPEYCPEVKDIDVVFRTVQLISTADVDEGVKVAFPGRTGNSRLIGMNWWEKLKSADGTILSNDAERKERIAELLDDTIYQSNKPQYIIKLDSVSIKEIRKQNTAIKEDNFTKNKSPYTNFDIITNDNVTPGYKGYYCYEEGDRKYCSSRFLTYLAEKNYLWGYCISQSGSQGSFEKTTTRAKNIAKGKYCLQS